MAAGDIVLTLIYVLTLFYTIFWLLTLLETREPKPRKAGRLPKVSIVLPSYNEEEYLEKSVDSVLALDYPKELLEIFIIDDGSTDTTLAVANAIQKKYPERNIQVIHIANQGKWAALNEGLKRASGELFSCLDADSFVAPDALKKAIPHFEEEKVAVVLPLLKVKNPSSFFQRVQWYEYVINMFYKKLIGFLNCIHVAPGPFSIYRASILRDVGGFRKAHLTEDLEIVLRMQEQQYKIVQITDAEVYTVAPENLKGIYRQRYRWFRGSLLNVWDYRRMLFNRAYGDFGMFQMPAVLFNGLIAVVLVTLTLYFNLLNPLYNALSRLPLIHFDIITLLSNFSFSMSVYDLNFYKLSIMVFFLLLSLFVVRIAHQFTRERLLKYGVKSILFFLFFYYITLAAVWVGLIIDIARKKEQIW
jgi:cellulose synthase/poly-beta-1,6-N-acetylglucosamine synthase-like glycosyltransferase